MMRTATSETPALVAQRLSDLLSCFPSAAAGGVQWQTLIRKYNERHSSSLHIAPFGHTSGLSAACALLFDVVRLVDGEDTDNPVLAIEDGLAMTAQPGAPATWPSLYQSLCMIVNEYGTQQEANGDGKVCSLLVSQLKPLLQRHWHNSFDEANLGYLTEEGTTVKVKKMKHLLQALPRWREERVAWRTSAQVYQPLDAVLEPQLELVPSKMHNDLFLRCVQPVTATPLVQEQCLWESHQQESQHLIPKSSLKDREDVQSMADSAGASAELELELAALRAENARLRGTNFFLQRQSQDDVLRKALFEAEAMVGLDDPSEPPHCEYQGNMVSPSGSTAASSDFGFRSGCATPFSVGSGSHSNSGAATPTSYAVTGQVGQMVTMVPMFFAMGDHLGIPSGVVEQARAIFECNKTLPSQAGWAMSCPGEVRMC